MKEINHLKDQRVDENIVLKWILKKSFGRAWSGFIWFGYGKITGC
jgi:hypothetical protein